MAFGPGTLRRRTRVLRAITARARRLRGPEAF